MIHQWPQVRLDKVVQWLQERIEADVYETEDVKKVRVLCEEILLFCGHRSATLPFAACMCMCVQIEAVICEEQKASSKKLPFQSQMPLFGWELEPVPLQRPLSYLRHLPVEKKHELLQSLAFARPFLAQMLSLEQGLQKHLALSDLLCAVDDARYMLAAPPTK